MRLVTAAQMKAIDKRAITRFGIPALCLMENAGRAAAEEAARMLVRSRNRKVLLLCGAGNNGGDGFVATRHLLNKGCVPVILFVGDAAMMKEPAAVNYKALRRLKVRFLRPTPGVLASLRHYGLVIDALYGIGLSRDIDGVCRRTIEAVNASGVPVLALDVPSGLDATTGKVRGVCVKANRTVTFAFAKKGLFAGEGRRYAGRVVVRDIGILLATF
jgi:NAD(P)H-hydrate epimerase